MGCGCGKKSTSGGTGKIVKSAPKTGANSPKKIRRVIKRTTKR